MSRHPAPNKALGQHFLFDPNILGRIVALAEVKPGDAVLEIGPGPGGLTEALSRAGARIWAVETDQRMVAHLKSLELPDLTIIEADALKTDYLGLSAQAGGKFKLVSNLPYNISGPLTARLLRQRAAFTDMTLMYQREVAERIAADPGGKDRGTLSVEAQAFCHVKMGFRVPPGAFRPPPKVESALIRLVVKEENPLDEAGEEMLWNIVHEAFQKRRKQLRNCLRHRLPEPDVLFNELGLTGAERPETLTTEVWLKLAGKILAT